VNELLTYAITLESLIVVYIQCDNADRFTKSVKLGPNMSV